MHGKIGEVCNKKTKSQQIMKQAIELIKKKSKSCFASLHEVHKRKLGLLTIDLLVQVEIPQLLTMEFPLGGYLTCINTSGPFCHCSKYILNLL
jgi:hypothetical protein